MYLVIVGIGLPLAGVVFLLLEWLTVQATILYTSVNEYSNLEFSVSSDTTLHAYVIGGTYSTYEYEISYARTGNVNSAAVFSNASVSGDHKSGETISANLTYADADGITGASPFFSWSTYDGSSYEAKGVSYGAYTIEDQDIGKTVFYTLTFKDDAGNWETSGYYSTYDTVVAGNSAPSGAPTISGTTSQGETLSVNTNDVTDLNGINTSTNAYQWLRGGSEISGATASTYTLIEEDVGSTITVRYSFTDNQNNNETTTSSATVTIANINDALIGVPTISGTESKNSILSANVDDVTDADGINTSTKGYQWLRDENEISDATSSTYTLTGSDVGTKITVRYSFTDNHGANETVVSSSTGLINNANNAPAVSSTAITSATLGTDYSYIFSGTDVDSGDILTLSSISLPNWLNFNVSTGILSGTPTSANLGVHTVKLRVSDDSGAVTDETFNITVSRTESEVVGKTTVSDTFSNYKTIAVIIDDFSPLSYTNDYSDNLHIYDYADYNMYDYNDLYSYDILYDTWDDYGDVDTTNSITLMSEYTNVNNYSDETNLLFETVGPVYRYGGYYDYVDTLYTASLGAHNPSTGSGARHGDFVLEAFTSSLDNPNDVEIILVDIDFTDTYDMNNLLNTTAVYGGEEMSELKHIVHQAFDEFYEEDTFYTLAGFNASWGGSDISDSLSVVEEFIEGDTFVVQAAPNVSQHGVNWSSVIPNVINVGAWNVDQDNYILAGQPSQLDTIDIYANGVVDDDILGWNFGTSFAAPKVFAELFNYYETNLIPLLKSGELVITNTDLSSAEETLVTDFIIDAISTDIELSVVGDSSYYGPYNLLTATIDNNTLAPVVVPYSADDFGYQLNTYSLYSSNNSPTGSVEITGFPYVSETLTATNDMADTDGLGTLNYQWKADGSNIAGATQSSYTLTSDEIGSTITIEISYEDGNGTIESVASSATFSVTNNATVVTDTTGDDIVTGTAYADTIGAGIGRDLVDALGGDDTITLTGNSYYDGLTAHNVGSIK